ncbi:MAG TPA: tetratricopeptide repeat protein [Allosphingosinicella sp.]
MRAAALQLILLATCLTRAGPAAAQPVPETLEAAREAARTDRNEESARLFKAHIRADPAARGALLREYADQLVYSGRPEAAVPLYREVLARPDLGAEERRRAEHGLALAFAWSDQHRHAIAAYRAILQEAPEDEAAQLGLARSLHWLGRPDRARAALELLPEESRGGGEGARIGADIVRNSRPRTQFTARLTGQSDDLDIASFRIDQYFHARAGAIQVTPFYERLRYRPEFGPEIRVDYPGLALRARLSDSVEIAGRAGIEYQDLKARDLSVFTYEVSLALMPSDDLRFDLAASRRTYDNVKSIERGITSDQVFVSGDYWPNPLWRVTGRAELSGYSDGNERQWGQAEVERRLSRSPNIFVGARATAFHFSEQLDNGYFNPKHLVSGELTARGWSEIAKGTWLDLAATAGPEYSDPDGTKLIYSGRARLTHRITDRLEASLIAEAFSGALTDTGFSRGSVIGSIEWRW